MACFNNRCLALVACLVMVALVELGRSPVEAQECKGLDIGQLMVQCGRFVQLTGPKIPPSDDCCTLLKGVDIACACKHIPEDVEKLVSVEKAVYVARYCGIKLQPGSKCGSYTIPPSV